MNYIFFFIISSFEVINQWFYTICIVLVIFVDEIFRLVQLYLVCLHINGTKINKYGTSCNCFPHCE